MCLIWPFHYTLPSCLSLRLRGEDGGTEREKGRNRRREREKRGGIEGGVQRENRRKSKVRNMGIREGKRRMNRLRETGKVCSERVGDKCNMTCVWRVEDGRLGREKSG